MVIQYSQKHLTVNIIIISDKHHTHGELTKNLLSLELPPDVYMEVYDAKELTKDIIEHLPHDIILSNFTLPKTNLDNIIVINDFRTLTDFKLIKQKINAIPCLRNSY